ncbi:RPC34, DNA-directed RNA polymerase III, partial [Pyrenophora tritici-repentis]
EPSELLASAQLAEQANWLSSLSLLIDICVIWTLSPDGLKMYAVSLLVEDMEVTGIQD